MRTALCADGFHDSCNGKCSIGYPENGIKDFSCTCPCHEDQSHLERADMEAMRDAATQ